MKNIPGISDAEWEVMKALWARSPQNSAEIVEALAPRTGWKPNTVKTLLARLIRKGAVLAATDSREYQYRPAISEEQCVKAENRSFLKRVHDGAMMPMIAGFLRHEKLSSEEIAELRSLLDKMEGRRK